MADAELTSVEATRFVSRIAAEWDASESWQLVDATLVFVDISGFTNLSERLARRGRVGAEELTEVLNRVFGAMLELAYDRGGSLLKFGGDALLLLFAGDDRVVQACSAAVEMRAALRDAAKIPTSVGRVPLRMSIGVHEGRVHLFLVGESHKELIVTGPAATETTEMEAAAAAGEIVVSPSVANALPRGSVGETKGPGHLLRWRTARSAPCGPTPRRDQTASLRALLPVALRAHLGSDRVESEHRFATIGFVKFKGVDALLENEGEGAVAAALDELVTTTQRAVDAEAVTFLATDLDADGGKVILTAGVPIAQEDDDGRLLRSARAIVDAPHRLAVRIGLNRGHVFAGEIGTPFRATYTVMGDTVNLAARLMAAAGPGELYASPPVLDRSRTLFETRALEPFSVKGKSEPVHAFAVGAEAGARAETVRETLPFHGREAEQEVLRRRADPRADDEPGVVVVSGDTGIGKTRLVTEVVAELGDVESVSIRAEAYASATPYRAMRDVMRELLGVVGLDAGPLWQRVAQLAPDLVPMTPLLGDVVHVEVPVTPEVAAIDPQFRRDRLADVLIELLDRAFERPLCFIVDDAHWLDDGSAHLLDRIAAASRSRRWSIIVVRPPGDAGLAPAHAHTIELGPLAAQVVRDLVIESTPGTPLRPHAIEQIVGRAGGSPLFLEEMLRTIRVTGDAEQLPDSLEEVIARQIDSLSPLGRRLLRYAAVLGRTFNADLAQRVLADEDLELDAATLSELGEFVVREGRGTLGFRHAIVRDVAYAGLPYRRRQMLHLRAGHAAEGLAGDDIDGAAATLSLHFTLGGDYSRAFRFARLAGDRARDSFANVEAATHYGRALDAARRLADVTDAERATLWTQLGDVRELAGMFEAALESYRNAARLSGDDRIQRAVLLLKQARARERSGYFVAALRNVNAGIKTLDGLSTAGAAGVRARLVAFSAMVRWGQERNRDALDRAERAVAMARSAGQRDALGHALMVADLAAFSVYGPGRDDRLREALAIFVELEDLPSEAQARANIGFIAASGARWDEAVEWLVSSRDAYDRCGHAVGSALQSVNLGEILIKQFRAAEAEPVLVDAVRVLRSVGFADGAAYAELQLAHAWCAAGRFDEANEVLVRVTSEFTAIGQRASALEAAIAHAELLLREGDPVAALALLDRYEKEAGPEAEQFVPHMALVRAAAMTELGDIERAELELTAGLTAARTRSLPYEEALLVLLADEVASRDGRRLDPAPRTAAEKTLTGLGVRLRDRTSALI